MDFKRIEIIFLVVFACLDIFLFVSYQQNQNIEMIDSSVSRNTTIKREMSNDQVTTPHLSSKTYTGYYLASKPNRTLQEQSERLTGQRVTFNDNRLYGHFYNSISARSNLRLINQLKEIMKNEHQILHGDQYRYSREFSTADRLVFTQKISEGDLYDEAGELVFQVNDNHQVTNYQQTYINRLTTLREKEQTISAKQAVQDLYTDNEISSGATIKWTSVGYSRLLDVNNSSVYIPAWFIAIENKNSGNIQIKRINAFTGALMKNNNDNSLATTASN
ncbi:two-component system regulatory protein YycI [Loigolactobacillus backii]|uniref:Regulator n=1 Tax=Loigolactobacillus backii TaxID=375175 RepID=A0A192H0P3_9LACO|nr:two-component system regulatory protein YycI [Loigolactobacillus backii]ANK61848.1 regulator [Loigolactobacillus backii]ANK68958.1 regulator [Loigolactobacillus backii]MDA5387476.1 two-component system regulatory protein YycI [Loigolactobacillus backii]MDA5390038.1 two-component system regulatory protein YycI [Loigolactobacillus backii]PIO82364.1 regulator [Loigolactobacillus backii]